MSLTIAPTCMKSSVPVLTTAVPFAVPLALVSRACCEEGASVDFKFEKGVPPKVLNSFGRASKIGPEVDEENPGKGDGLVSETENLLFELNTDRKLRKVQKRLVEMISMFEPRVNNVQVKFSDLDTNEISLTIYYSIINGLPNQSMEMTVTRAR